MEKEGDRDPLGILNPEDDTSKTWNHHYQVSQNQQATKKLHLNKNLCAVMDCSIKNIKGRATKGLQLNKNLREVTDCSIKRRAMKGLQLNKNLRAVMDCSIKRRAMKGLQLNKNL